METQPYLGDLWSPSLLTTYEFLDDPPSNSWYQVKFCGKKSPEQNKLQYAKRYLKIDICMNTYIIIIIFHFFRFTNRNTGDIHSTVWGSLFRFKGSDMIQINPTHPPALNNCKWQETFGIWLLHTQVCMDRINFGGVSCQGLANYAENCWSPHGIIGEENLCPLASLRSDSRAPLCMGPWTGPGFSGERRQIDFEK